MDYDLGFGPAPQTPAQRTWVLEQMQAMIPSLKVVDAHMRQLYARYIAGEIDWLEVRQARLDAGL